MLSLKIYLAAMILLLQPFDRKPKRSFSMSCKDKSAQACKFYPVDLTAKETRKCRMRQSL